MTDTTTNNNINHTGPSTNNDHHHEDGTRTSNARRSRAERAKVEMDRRRRSNSKSGTRSSNNSSSSAMTGSNTNAGSSSNVAMKSSVVTTSVAATSSGGGTAGGNIGNSSSGSKKTGTSNNSVSNSSNSSRRNNSTGISTSSSSSAAIYARRERFEEMRTSKKSIASSPSSSAASMSNMSGTSSNNNHGSAAAGTNTGSRADMSPTGRMRLQQQVQLNQQQPQQSSMTSSSSSSFQPYTSRKYEPMEQIQQQLNEKQIHSSQNSSNDKSQQATQQQSSSLSPSSSEQNTALNYNPTNPKPQSPLSQQPATSSTPKPLNSSSSSVQQPPNTKALSLESPLPPLVSRALGDRSYEKRKNAALEIEQLVKDLAEGAITFNHQNNNNSNNMIDQRQMIYSLIQTLSNDFCRSMNSNFRKGGLIGLAATGIGLMSQQLINQYLEFLIHPVIHCFDDPEARVRYYACESLYNIVKVARGSMLPYFNLIFDGLTKLFADVDDAVKNGANLLDRLVKDIVTESEDFSVDEFLPLLQNYIRRTNPYIRQLLVGWITVLDGIPDVSMLDYLPDFLDGLFNMLADSNREIRQAADSALCEFLKEIRSSTVVEFGPIVSILVFQCHSKDRLNRLTAITWLSELIHHPHSGGDALLPFHAEILSAILSCISDSEVEIRKVSDRTNADLLTLVKDTKRSFELRVLLDTLMKELSGKEDVPTKMAVLKWVNMLLEKRRQDLNTYTDNMLPFLLQSLSDSSDNVVLLTVQVLSRITLSSRPGTAPKGGEGKQQVIEMVLDEAQFLHVIKAILALFASDRRLLETRGSLIVRRLCVLLNAKSVYTIMAEIISSFDISNQHGDSFTLEFVATMIQILNLILLTASELHNLRKLLESSFSGQHNSDDHMSTNSNSELSFRLQRSSSSHTREGRNEGAQVFAALFQCWCNNPVSTFSLCLLARAYDLAFAVVKKFSELEVTVGFLMQIDKLVHLLESPVFVHVRLQLLDVEAPYHTYLLKSCYGLLMLLPQSEAFQCLNDRLASVCNLRDNLGVKPAIMASPNGVIKTEESSVFKAGLDAVVLLDKFDKVMTIHQSAREAIQRQGMKNDKTFVENDVLNKRNAKPKLQQNALLSPQGNMAAVSNSSNIQRAGIGAVISSGIK